MPVNESRNDRDENSYYKYIPYIHEHRGKHEHNREMEDTENPNGTSREENNPI